MKDNFGKKLLHQSLISEHLTKINLLNKTDTTEKKHRNITDSNHLVPKAFNKI